MNTSSRTNKPGKRSGKKSRGRGAQGGTGSNNPTGHQTRPSTESQPSGATNKPIHPFDLEALTGSGVILTTRTGRQLEGTLVGTATDAGGWGAALQNVKDLTNPSQALRKRVSVDFKDIATCVPQPRQSTPQSPEQSQVASHLDDPQSKDSTRGAAERGTDFNKPAESQNGSSAAVQPLQETNGSPYSLSLVTLIGSRVILTTRTNKRWEGTLTAMASDAGAQGAVLQEARDLNNPALRPREHMFVPTDQIVDCVPQQVQPKGSQDPPIQPQLSGPVDNPIYGPISSTTAPLDRTLPTAESASPVSANTSSLVPLPTIAPATPLAETPKSDVPKVAINDTESAKPGENNLVGSFREFVTNDNQRLAQKIMAIAKSEKEKRMAELVAFSQGFKLNKPIPKDLVSILTKDTEKAKLIVEKSSQDAASTKARQIGGTQVASGLLFKKPVVSVNPKSVPNSSAIGKSNLPKMYIQPIPPFNPIKAGRTGTRPASGIGDRHLLFGKMNDQPIPPFDPNKDKGAGTSLESGVEGTEKDVGVEPTTPPNLFYGTGVLKTSREAAFKGEFNPFEPASVVEPSLIGNMWPYTGRSIKSLTMFPLRVPPPTSELQPSLEPEPQSSGPLPAPTQPVDHLIDATAPIIYPTQIALIESIVRRNEVQRQAESSNTPNPGPVLSSAMSVEQITTLLRQHGYPDITTQLNLEGCSKYPQVHGGAADIYCGHLHNGRKVAIKRSRVRVPNDENGRACLRAIAKEGYVWSKYRHPNILETFGVVRFQDGIALVAPWMENGTVMDYIRVQPHADRLKLCVGIACGLAYLHGMKTTHGDLKGANVLVSQDGLVKLNDFGSTSMKHHTLQFTGGTHSRQYTLRWAAPEMLSENGDITGAADVYALGMTILEVVTGKQPYEHLRREESVTAALFRGDRPRRPEATIPSMSSQGDKLWDLLQLCWKTDPQNRPSAQDAMNVLSLITPEGLRT